MRISLTITLMLMLIITGGTTATAGTTGHYSRPHIDIEKYVSVDGGEWQDADEAPGPKVNTGSSVEFLFVVINPLPRPISDLELTDTVFDTSGCELPDVLGPYEIYECMIGPFDCVDGQHMNLATITGWDDLGNFVTDSDPAHYKGNCEGGDVGTGTPGYWMNHPQAWPVGEITIGGLVYDRDAAIALMRNPVVRDKTYTMFPALVAAKLNVMIGCEDSCIADVILAADAWMADNPVGSDVRGNSEAWETGEPLYETLDLYNNGELCAPSRDDLEEIAMLAR
jgi:hypothetical protein